MTLSQSRSVGRSGQGIRRGRGPVRRLARASVVPVIGLAVGVVGWQLAGAHNPVLFATPGRSISAIADLAIGGTLLQAVMESGTLLVVGLAFAIVFGVGYGLVVARSRWVRENTEWLLYVAQAIPIVALTPFILSAFGFGLPAKALVVYLAAVFPIAINTAHGAYRVPLVLLEVARVFRSNEWDLWWHVLIPHTVPYAMTGIRQGIAMAFVGTLAAEFFLNASGVGGLLLSASARFDSPTAVGLTILLAVAAVSCMRLASLLEDTFSTWRPKDDR